MRIPDLLSTKKGLPEPSFRISLASARGPAVPMGSFSCGSACTAIRLETHSDGPAPGLTSEQLILDYITCMHVTHVILLTQLSSAQLPLSDGGMSHGLGW